MILIVDLFDTSAELVYERLENSPSTLEALRGSCCGRTALIVLLSDPIPEALAGLVCTDNGILGYFEPGIAEGNIFSVGVVLLAWGGILVFCLRALGWIWEERVLEHKQKYVTKKTSNTFSNL